jgi:hypothetical protein
MDNLLVSWLKRLNISYESVLEKQIKEYVLTKFEPQKADLVFQGVRVFA